METLNYLAYFCKNVLSICMNRLKKVMLFSSGCKNTDWRVAFWGESILMVRFVILGFVIKPLENERYASLFVQLLLLSNTTTYVHHIISY